MKSQTHTPRPSKWVFVQGASAGAMAVAASYSNWMAVAALVILAFASVIGERWEVTHAE